MASRNRKPVPRRYLTLLQCMVDMDTDTLGIILPYLEQRVREVLYIIVAQVVYHSKDRIDQEKRNTLADLLSEKKEQVELLARPSVPKLRKRRMLRDLAGELQIILSAALNMLVASSPPIRKKK